MKTQMFLVLIVALLHTSNCDSDGLVCYQCDKMALGRDCNLVDKCGPHQVCSNERFITNSGIVYYKSGCKPKIFCPSSGKKRSDVSDCLECCTQDYCNKDLCDFPKVTELEDRCLKCDDVDHPSQCTDVTRCGPDQICFTDLHFNYGLNSPRFVLGCRDKRSSLLQQCGSHLVNLFGRDSQKRSTTCHECCNTENCNRKLCVNATLNFIATTASQTSISRDLSTPPTKTQNATVKIDLSTTKLTTTQMFSSSALPTTTSSSTQTAPGSALLTAPSSVTQTAPGSALPTTPSSDIPTSQIPSHGLDMPITVSSQWNGGFYGSFNLAPHHSYHGWCAHLVFDKPIHTIEIWLANLVKACPGNKEFLAHSLTLNGDISSGSSMKVAIVGRMDGSQAPTGHVYLSPSCRVCGTGHNKRASKLYMVEPARYQDPDPLQLKNPDLRFF